MDKLAGFGLLLIAAFSIGMTCTLTKVMSQDAYAQTRCPANWHPDPKQTPYDKLSHGLKCDPTFYTPAGEPVPVKYVPLTPAERMSLCVEEREPPNC
jgi:hypothetical protein